MTDRLRFGIFMAPFHRAGENPTLALERDLDLIGLLDRLGYDEAWIGEHHSAGTEIIASPEIFIATAAERTRHIRLGTGVTSVAYHNPYMIAERAVLLDHLTRGRFMLGVGPGISSMPGSTCARTPTRCSTSRCPPSPRLPVRVWQGATVWVSSPSALHNQRASTFSDCSGM
jgi:limonene 1,2-monooxygenase